ncbi:MAG TPA: ABC transporter ATP-binding protein [Bacteroidales bacterium]|nr:ABC transporter ATP-binding protein [Bacteroidales bacterium]
MSDAVIKVNKAVKRFKEVVAVDGLDLTIEKGTFAAILGPNGAGKTTLVEMIEGLQHPDHGEIKLFGEKWDGNRDSLHKRMGISLQETRFIDRLTVAETLRLFASFYEVSFSRVDEIIGLIRLTEKRKTWVVNLSGGQRQRLALGIALLNDPELLMLDEPTTGLDPNSRREIWEILLRLKETGRTTMILTTHYMEEAAVLCDQIIIMDKGKILTEGSLDYLLKKHSIGEIIELATDSSFNHFVEKDKWGIRKIKSNKDGNRLTLNVDEITETLPHVLAEAKEKEINLTSIECRKMTLDDLFVSMTGRKLTD